MENLNSAHRIYRSCQWATLSKITTDPDVLIKEILPSIYGVFKCFWE